jgi:regulatory protein
MKITAISPQIKSQNRVNISVDGKYRFSLDIYQLVDLGIKTGREYNEAELVELMHESQFGKVYSRALEYCLMRPRSAREVRDYLYRKTRPVRSKTGELISGVSSDITNRVFDRLLEKKYIDDAKFAKYWVENRSVIKGTSIRKLQNELRLKGVENTIISQVLDESERNDDHELKKIIIKKRLRYPDDNKLIAYLARLGFNYDDIKTQISEI